MTDYFSAKDVCGNFDWDCSGTEEKQSVHLVTRCVTNTAAGSCDIATSDGPPTADCGTTYTGGMICQLTTSSSGDVVCYLHNGGGTVTYH